MENNNKDINSGGSNNDVKYIVIGVVVVLVVGLILFFMSQENNVNHNNIDYTGDRTKFIQSYDNVNKSKICEEDNDCALSDCGGCFSKEFLDTQEPELPCSKFEGYACLCEMGACTEIKR